MFEDAPLYSAVRNYARKNPARFHTPGHKGVAAPLREVFGRALELDVTELEETDSLFDAAGPILDAEQKAAEAFGMEHTLLSAGGATLCIQAMLRLATQSGKTRVVMGRNLHRSAVNTLCLLDLKPVWVWPRRFAGSSLPSEIRAEDVEAALDRAPDAAAVYLTSPDYYGVLSDIGAIARVCSKRGVPLLVDNAHGAHLLCVDGGALHPVRLGASMSCDSAHKTLPVLTGGAWLQIGRGAGRRQAKAAMELFGSTSPSYLTMLSLDLARAWMETEGEKAFDGLCGKVAEIRSLCSGLGYFQADARFDPARITLDTASVGRSGSEAAQILRREGVEPEMYDDRHVVLLPSPFQPEEDFERLIRAVRKIPSGHPIRLKSFEPETPVQKMSPRQAMIAEGETVELSAAAGRVAAESRCPCPPGIPVVMPGEQITEKLAHSLKNYGVASLNVVK